MKAVSHIADLGGEKHVGIGSDTIAMIEKLCRFKNYDNFSQIAAYFEEKLGKKTARGFMGKNFLDYLAR
jgi:microsomal dipeptidase-like Zn-dependent dipeptidase